MATLDIRQYGDPVLRETAEPIDKIEARHRELAKNMAETMYASAGIGLAGNQVGVLERIIVIDVDYARSDEGSDRKQKPIVMVNPEIIEESTEDDSYEEGCLSMPGVLGEVWRPWAITVRYQDLDGNKAEQECEDLFARCVQHEIDHLDGVLFPDRMGKLKRKLIARAISQLQKEYDRKQGAA